MGEDPRQVGEVGDNENDTRTPEEIEADIERTRRDLGDTVAAVAEKADVKTQAKLKVDEAKARVKERVSAAKPESTGDGANKVGSFAEDHKRELVIGGAVLVAFLLGRAAGKGKE
jgi:Protein of unknown function (DUF3618)